MFGFFNGNSFCIAVLMWQLFHYSHCGLVQASLESAMQQQEAAAGGSAAAEVQSLTAEVARLQALLHDKDKQVCCVNTVVRKDLGVHHCCIKNFKTTCIECNWNT